MKLLLLVLLFFSLDSFSQIDIENESLIDSSVDIVYSNFLNILAIKGVDIDSSYHLLNGKDTIVQRNKKFYHERRKIICDTFTLVKYDKIIYQKVFKSEFLLNFKIYLGDIRDSIVSKEVLLWNLNNRGFIAGYWPQFAICNTTVRNVSAYVKKKNGRIIRLNENNKNLDNIYDWSDEKYARKIEKEWVSRCFFGSNTFRKKDLKVISRMKKGDELIVESLGITCPSCVMRAVNVNLRFRIK